MKLHPSAFAFVALVPLGWPQESSPAREAQRIWADFDRDRFEDLFAFGTRGNDVLLRNLGDGSFSDATVESGLAGLASRTARAEDFDADGDPDLLLVSVDGMVRLLEAQDGIFHASRLFDGLDLPSSLERAEWIDYDRDGALDLELATALGEVLLLHNRGGRFERVELGLTPNANTAATALPIPIGDPTKAPSEDTDGSSDSGRRPVPSGPPILGNGSAPGKVARTTEVPVDVSLSGVSGGSSNAIPFPACALALKDQDGTGCLGANSVPTLGMLCPLSNNLFIEAATGEVGIGTTSPVARLHVNGVSRFAGNLTFQDDSNSIRFPAASGFGNPMIEMFVSGTSNADRMVLGHSPAYPTLGLEYEDAPDRFVFQRNTGTPVFSIDLPNGDLLIGEDTGTIKFPNASGTTSPMIEMFGGGVNADRMVLGHSAGTPNWGLKYKDSPGCFVFQRDTASPVATIDLPGGDLLMGDDLGTIRFPNASGVTRPMIEMFGGGGGNADRMVIAHSAGALDWGLKYADGTDRFIFQQLNSSPVFTVDLFSKDLTLHDGSLKITNSDPIPPLEVGTSNGIVSAVANIERFSFHTGNSDVLQVKVPFGSSPSAQYIEAEDNTQIYFRVDVSGTVYADGAYTGPADFAEMFQVTSGAESVEPGDVLVIDPASARGVRRSSSARSTHVLGIFSTNPGFVGSERQWEELESPAPDGERKTLDRSDMARLYDEVPVAMIGVVPCKVSAENGPIQPGDLLVTSSTPGYAMRDEDPKNGTIVGKALEPLASGTGKIRIAVTLQ